MDKKLIKAWVVHLIFQGIYWAIPGLGIIHIILMFFAIIIPGYILLYAKDELNEEDNK